VEVALLGDLAHSIAPLLDENAAPENLQKATAAIFYSISNTQAGLRGVGFGDSLIKRVVQVLKDEFPKLKTFATLSPIPGLKPWVSKNMDSLLKRAGDKQSKALQKSLGLSELNGAELIKAIDGMESLSKNAVLESFLKQAAAVYLGQTLVDGHPVDSVAKFHLHNGARVERINWGADPSTKGYKQSWGIMVNYLYDLRKLDRHRMLLAKGKITVSSDVEDLFLPSEKES
jgi:malonyl-CoA decarboxylase